MFFLLPGERYDLLPRDFSLLDRSTRGDAMPPMPRCNAYGLQGTEFLDPPPVPRATARERSWMAVGPPFGDFSPDDYGVFDDEDEGEEGLEEQGRTPPPASPRGERETPARGKDAGVEPPPGSQLLKTRRWGRNQVESPETFRPRLLPKMEMTRACRCRIPSKTLW